MAPRFNCPACGQTLTLPEGSTAETVKCPSCAKVIRIRRQAPPNAQPAAPQPTVPPPPPSSASSLAPDGARAVRSLHPPIGRRHARRPKRSSRGLWLAGIGAAVAVAAVAIILFLSSGVAITIVNESAAVVSIGLTPKDPPASMLRCSFHIADPKAIRLTPGDTPPGGKRERMETLNPGETRRLRLKKGVYGASFIFITSEGALGVLEDVVVENKERWLFKFDAGTARLEKPPEP